MFFVGCPDLKFKSRTYYGCLWIILLVLGSNSYYFYFALSYTSYLVPILNIFIGSNNERALLNLFRLSRRYLLMKLLSW